MPKLQYERLPKERWAHLRDRAKDRKISEKDLFQLAEWRVQDPDVPDGDWYKDFGTFTLRGTGKYPSTFLIADPTQHAADICEHCHSSRIRLTLLLKDKFVGTQQRLGVLCPRLMPQLVSAF